MPVHAADARDRQRVGREAPRERRAQQQVGLVAAEDRRQARLARGIDEVDALRAFHQKPQREVARLLRLGEARLGADGKVRDRLVADRADEVDVGLRDGGNLGDDDDAPGRVGDHAPGPAAVTAASTVSANWAKFSRNMRARSAALPS